LSTVTKFRKKGLSGQRRLDAVAQERLRILFLAEQAVVLGEFNCLITKQHEVFDRTCLPAPMNTIQTLQIVGRLVQHGLVDRVARPMEGDTGKSTTALKRLPMKSAQPDFYFAQNGLAVFVDGCFWHGCERCGHLPSKNAAFWKAKIERNRQRDHEKTRALIAAGIKVLRFWEHELRDDLQSCVDELRRKIAVEARRKP
jgi:G:T-mismatch repair DNA endonuclease (very short patch repair protein)